MPKKKPEKPVIVKNWESKMYSGYVSDVYALFGTVKEINIEADIDEVLPALNDRLNSLPKDDTKRLPLNGIITQLIDIRNFAAGFWGSEELINTVLNWNKTDSEEAEIAVNEEKYKNNVNFLLDHVSSAKALMYKDSVPTNIKANLDNYNLLDNYADYMADNSAFLKLDGIFRKTMKLFTQVTRIDFLVKKYRAEKDLEDKLDYDKKNLIEHGKDCVNTDGFSIRALQDKYDECVLKGSEYKNAVQSAESNKNEVKNRLDRLNADRNDLINQRDNSVEEKRAAEKKYNETKASVETFKRIKVSLKDTFEMEIPSLEGMVKIQNKKYLTFSEMLNTMTEAVDDLAATQLEYVKDKEKKQDEISNGLKKSKDTRLFDFNNNEATRYKYKKYPVMAREIVRVLKELPEDVGFDPSDKNFEQVDAEINKRIKDKVGDPRMWNSISCMLNEAKTYDPGNFASMKMNEDSFKACENEGADIIKKIEEDKIHTLIFAIEDLEGEEDTFLATDDWLETEAKKRLKEDPKKKNKSFWDQYNTEKKKNEALRKNVLSKIEDIKKNKDYIRGASSISRMRKSVIKYSEKSFNTSCSQVDMFISIYNQEEKSKGLYMEGIEGEKQKIYDKLNEIYQSVPDDVFSKNKIGKENSQLHDFLFMMQPPAKDETFKSGYELFIKELDNLKKDYSDEKERSLEEDLNNARTKLESYNYETRISELNTQISQVNEEYSAKLSVYEQKKNVLAQNDQTQKDLEDQIKSREKYYNRKVEAESFDPNNDRQNDYKTEIKGTRFVSTLKQPFIQLYGKREMAKTQGHKDTPEFERMRDALCDVVDLDDNTDIATYKQKLSNAKDLATAYLNKKEKQLFVNKSSSMRKFRLSFARDIIDLCSDQIDKVEGNEFGQKLNPAVEAYLSRTEPIEVKVLNEEEKEAARKAYNDSLDQRAEDAKKAYLNSDEYKLNLPREAKIIEDELKEIKDKIEVQNNILKEADNNEDQENNIINDGAKEPKDKDKIRLSTKNTIEQLNKRREELIRQYQHNKMLQAKQSMSEVYANQLTLSMENIEMAGNQPEIIKVEEENKQNIIINN